MHDLTGKRALITGGSAGLGFAIAKKLAEAGAICAINYANNDQRAQQALQQLASSDKHALVKGSPFQRDGARQIVAHALSHLGGLDYIVSNAGWTKFADFKDLNALDESAWDETYAANVKAHLWLMQAAQDELKKNRGSMVIIASVAGLRPSGSSMAYSVAKSATIHLAKCLAVACAPEIQVNSIAPGLLKTDWSERFSAEQWKAMIDKSALNRIAELDDTADAAVTLLCNKSITGVNVEVSAGFAM